MRGKRYLKIVLPLLLISIVGSVTSCFMFFMDWGGGIEGDWIYRNTSINETVYLTVKKDSVVMIFDEDNPFYPITPLYFSTPSPYFNDWGFKGDLSVDEDSNRLNITIYELYRYYSQWYNFYRNYYPYYDYINKERTRGGWYNSADWFWTGPPYFSNYYYYNFLNSFPGSNLGASGRDITCEYHREGDNLSLRFDPGGHDRTFDFTRN